MQWIRNHWYPAAWSTEVGRQLVSRTFFDEAAVLFRKENGEPAMLLDRCPHKGAPLSLGELKSDRLVCPYHGLEFECSGRCVRIPSQENIPPSARVRVYPCTERYGLVWFWPGDPALADESALFTFERYGASGWECIEGPYTHFPAGIESIADNLVDPAHTTFVHRGTIGGPDASDVPLTVQQEGDAVVVGRWIENSQPVPVMQRHGKFVGPVDRWQYYYFYSPNISLVDMGAVAAGAPRDEASRDAHYRTLSYAALTPETGSTTHYFWFVLRSFALGDQQVSDEMRQAYVATFDEDRALLGAIQRNAGGIVPGSLRLAIDNASIRVRRSLERMAAVEAAQAHPVAQFVPIHSAT